MINDKETRTSRAKRMIWSLSLLFFALPFLLSGSKSHAQQLFIPVTDKLPPVEQSSNQEEEEFIKPARPGVSNPAEIHKPGVVQLEYGYDALFRGPDFRLQQVAPLALRFAASSRLLIELDLDTVKSETDDNRVRMTGIGDTRVGFQAVALQDTEKHPALAFAYFVKLPSASMGKGLGTGRFDHKIVALVSKKFGKTDMDINGAYLIVGREGESGWVTGGQGAISFSHEFENKVGVQGELSGQTKDDVQPPGLYALGAVTFKLTRRFALDSGMRFGLTEDAPRIGVFAGMTVGLADLYRKRP